ncbi:hypothetical protein JW813_12575 [Clostridium botulinum]|uniref:hypothetical protein n=1 Tax=Clostridium botulinum TaxID=1491 RepID=UPI002246F167|nr:hypothetical protein [Clostridium botulinum]UZP02549.1 hypothetical protein JW813_12575 [Clostridium botulinum]UZP05908.1 hypothetical protein JYA71_12845 [Clostridium botulinum]UZP09289.1 hypothetical protein JYA74_12570 [Clostridium botulinum]
MKTISELEMWLEDNYYSFDNITIGKHRAYEGNVIEFTEGKYCFNYSERGNKIVKESFDTEKELVDYSLAYLEKNKWNKAHIIAYTIDACEINELQQLLNRMKIDYERNDIPNYRNGIRVYRIFVFGTVFKKVEHLKSKYIHYQCI